MGLFLGLDGGGTKTEAVILGDKGTEIGRGQGGPCNIATGNNDLVAASVISAVHSALNSAGLPSGTPFEAVCAGVAGYSAVGQREQFTQMLPTVVRADQYGVEPDYRIAWWGASGGKSSVIVIAGTGAVAYGRTEDGVEFKTDGRGFLLGDRGSGFEMGRFALRQLVLLLDRGELPNALELQIMREIGAKTADEIVEWTYRDFSPDRIAGVSTVIGKMAATGDRHAASLIAGAASALRQLAGLCFKNIGATVDMPIYLAGGLWKCSPILRERFEFGRPKEIKPAVQLSCHEPEHGAAYGAALCAIHASLKGNP